MAARISGETESSSAGCGWGGLGSSAFGGFCFACSQSNSFPCAVIKREMTIKMANTNPIPVHTTTAGLGATFAATIIQSCTCYPSFLLMVLYVVPYRTPTNFMPLLYRHTSIFSTKNPLFSQRIFTILLYFLSLFFKGFFRHLCRCCTLPKQHTFQTMVQQHSQTSYNGTLYQVERHHTKQNIAL